MWVEMECSSSAEVVDSGHNRNAWQALLTEGSRSLATTHRPYILTHEELPRNLQPTRHRTYYGLYIRAGPVQLYVARQRQQLKLSG